MAPTKKTTAKKAATKSPAKTATKTAAKKKATGPKGTPAILTLKHLAAELAVSQDMSKKQAEETLNQFVSLIGKYLKKGSKIRIVGLGILQVRHRPARMGRNPATGEAIKIKASKKIAFRPAKDLKEAV